MAVYFSARPGFLSGWYNFIRARYRFFKSFGVNFGPGRPKMSKKLLVKSISGGSAGSDSSMGGSASSAVGGSAVGGSSMGGSAPACGRLPESLEICSIWRETVFHAVKTPKTSAKLVQKWPKSVQNWCKSCQNQCKIGAKVAKISAKLVQKWSKSVQNWCKSGQNQCKIGAKVVESGAILVQFPGSSSFNIPC